MNMRFAEFTDLDGRSILFNPAQVESIRPGTPEGKDGTLIITVSGDRHWVAHTIEIVESLLETRAVQ
jgi:uncharacterized protein YlzI (FlbEa/FlbD family)